jgi:hypothetical protein
MSDEPYRTRRTPFPLEVRAALVDTANVAVRPQQCLTLAEIQ